MIMPRGHGQLLLPANSWFIAASFLASVAVHMLPLGVHAAMPDLVALVLVFWAVQQPRRVGVVLGFLLGLVMDVAEGALLGQHALAYSLMAFAAGVMHRRLSWFSLPEQMLQVLPVFAGGTLVMVAARAIAGDGLPEGWLAAAPVAQALLWPLAGWVLLAPQRRPPDPDKHRPL
ncbi:MAG: rod shape-determining protein MreD [Rubrivivax sp.]